MRQLKREARPAQNDGSDVKSCERDRSLCHTTKGEGKDGDGIFYRCE